MSTWIWRWKAPHATLLLVSSLGFVSSAAATTVAWEQIEYPPIVFVGSGGAMAYDSARHRVVMFGGGDGANETAEWDGTTWMNVTPAVSPLARWGQAMAYDSGRGRVVLFGGSTPGEYGGLADGWVTWEWDGASWTAVTPAVSPSYRWNHAMVYDSGRGRVVLFGGESDGRLGDTWEWDGTAWTDVTPAVSPPARYYPAMAYDSARGRVVLFGGDSYFALGDTWEWDGTAWTDVTPAVGPNPRYGHAMAYDSARQRVVMFGGGGSNETWEWDGTTWADVTPDPSPPGGWLSAMAYDSARGRVVLDAGGTWEWDGTSWSRRVRIPPRILARQGHAMAYDSARGRVVLFGGYHNDAYLADTWEWDGSAWTAVTPSVGPPSRSGHAMAYDSARGRVVLFGGFGLNCITGYGCTWDNLADTWEWDGTAWTDVTPAVTPPARSGHAMAYDSARGRVVLFGGGFAGTWEWDGAVWTSVASAVSPPTRYYPAMAYDSARGRVVLFGGHNWPAPDPDDPCRFECPPVSPIMLRDTWEWNGTTWRNVTSAANPPGRSRHAMAYDSERGRVLLFAGAHLALCDNTWQLCPLHKFADTWAWDGTAWTNLTPNVSPSGRYSHAAAYDSVRDRLVLFGGADEITCDEYWCTDHPIADTWEFGPLPERICDELDDNADGVIDEGCDDDGDGYCAVAMSVRGTPTICPLGGGDCDPSNPHVYPGADEICNAIDDDCDSRIDNGMGPGTVVVVTSPAELWPPNHRMADIHATVSLDGGCPSACPAPPAVTLVSVTSSEPDDAAGGEDGQTVNDIQYETPGAADFDLKLRAERDGGGAGRLYRIGYQATDCFGDLAVGYGGVVVPHDKGGGTEPLVLTLRPLPGAAGSHALEWEAVTGAWAYNVVRGSMASIRASGSFTILESVECIGHDLTVTSLSGPLVDEDPPVGEALFYLAEYLEGARSGYGTAAGGRELVIVSGDPCH